MARNIFIVNATQVVTSRRKHLKKCLRKRE